MKPICVDLFCGLGGWTEGFLAEGYQSWGFDIERHDYGSGGYPGDLVLQDILTLHGSQFKDATVIVASPPCQEFSYMAMPWSRGKTVQAEYLAGLRDVKKLTALFDACFRIQCEAIEAAGRYIPLVVENVRGAQRWVGRSNWHYGSFHLWGDVPALMPITVRSVMKRGVSHRSNGETDFHGWQSESVNGTKCTGQINGEEYAMTRGAIGQKNPGFRFDGSGRSFQSESVKTHREISPGWHSKHYDETEKAGLKGENAGWFNDAKRKGGRETGRLSQSGSKSSARKAASAQIAKIPFPLARHIARVYKDSASHLSVVSDSPC